jgi:hypothetical protein
VKPEASKTDLAQDQAACVQFTPPSCASLAIFPDEYPKPHACTAVAVLARLTKFHQSVAQFVVLSRRWGDPEAFFYERRGSESTRGLSSLAGHSLL